MNYAEQIIRDILKEEANLNSVSDAIKKRYEVEITYKADDDPEGSGKRVIQPVTLGHSKSNNLVLRAFQPYGDTKTKRPAWKMFRLDRIEEWEPNKNKHFKEPPGMQFKSEGDYNPKGDKSMIDVLVQAKFSGSEEYASGVGRYSGLKRANDERAARKREKDPFYQLKKNIKNSYNGNDIDYIRKNIEDWKASKAADDFKRGNNSSAYEMSQVQNFGNENNSQTTGPIMKDQPETIPQNRTNVNYTNVRMNGPVYKDQEYVDPIETSDDSDYYNNEENENK